jgi:parallel beta-helix repeat protein
MAPISSVDNVTYTLTDNIRENVPVNSSAIIIQRDNIIIDGAGYTLQGTQALNSKGIELTGRSNVTIKNMEITAFWDGIWLNSSSNNTVSGNNIIDNNVGIYGYSSSNNNSVCENNITNNGDGIILETYSSNNSVSKNNITANNATGIYLYSSSDNSVCGNNITNNLNSIWLISSSDNSVSGNNITNNDEFGIELYYSSVNSVCGNNITNDGDGIMLLYSSKNSVSGNSVTNNKEGIYGYSAGDSSISGNNITNNLDGIYLGSSYNNSISGNNATENSQDGIFFYSASNFNTISGNNATENSHYGICMIHSSDNTISGNNATANGYDGIYLDWSSNSNINGNNAANNLDGIMLSDASNSNTVSGNNATANFYGIALEFSSSNNKIAANNMVHNGYGLQLLNASYNTIYHNSFTGNSVQTSIDSASLGNAWNDTYPSGGNYWSDYAGVDLYSGPYQNQTGSDGIGDTIYVIDSNNTDHYPLMQPWAGPMPTPTYVHDVAVTNVTVVVPHGAGNAENGLWVFQGLPVYVNVTVLNKGDFAENVNLTLYYNMTANEIIGTQNITIPVGEGETASFVWDTTGVPYFQNYTITAVATIPLDINPADNTLACGPINVRIMGDINGDGKIDGRDIATVAKSFGSCGPNFLYQGSAPSPTWNLDADLNGDNKIDGKDIVLLAKNFGK